MELSYAQALYDGSWGLVVRPLIKEMLPFAAKFRSLNDVFYRFRRAVRVLYGSDDVGEDALRDMLLEVGTEAYLLEVVAPTITDIQDIMNQIRVINRTYKQQEDFASVELSNFEIENRAGKFYATCTVFCKRASDDNA